MPTTLGKSNVTIQTHINKKLSASNNPFRITTLQVEIEGSRRKTRKLPLSDMDNRSFEDLLSIHHQDYIQKLSTLWRNLYWGKPNIMKNMTKNSISCSCGKEYKGKQATTKSKSGGTSKSHIEGGRMKSGMSKGGGWCYVPRGWNVVIWRKIKGWNERIN